MATHPTLSHLGNNHKLIGDKLRLEPGNQRELAEAYTLATGDSSHDQGYNYIARFTSVSNASEVATVSGRFYEALHEGSATPVTKSAVFPFKVRFVADPDRYDTNLNIGVSYGLAVAGSTVALDVSHANGRLMTPPGTPWIYATTHTDGTFSFTVTRVRNDNAAAATGTGSVQLVVEGDIQHPFVAMTQRLLLTNFS